MQPDSTSERKANRALLTTMAVVVAAVAVIAVVGFIFMNRPDNYIEGQVEGTNIRISGKLPGRVVEFYAHEGDTVKAGDTLVRIHSSVVEAQLGQAEAMRQVAQAQNKKVDAGTRVQIVEAAADLLRQAEAGVTITEKTYRRSDNLFDQVQAVLDDSYLVAPCDGTVDQVYPEPGELVAMGAPIMSLLKADDRYVVFNVREELLNELNMGKTVEVMIPALDKKKIDVKIYYVRDMGSYATWRSTKSTGSYDSRTFRIKARPDDIDGLRPGMSVVMKQP